MKNFVRTAMAAGMVLFASAACGRGAGDDAHTADYAQQPAAHAPASPPSPADARAAADA